MSSKKRGKPSGPSGQASVQANRAALARARGGGGPTQAPPAAQTSAPREAPAAPPAGLFEYVDVAAVHIQDWLGRTPSLKLRRGASVLLIEATEDSQWEQRLPEGVKINPEAGHIDGVVSLRWPAREGTGPDASGADPSPHQVAVGVVRTIREQLPHLPLKAVGTRAASYVEAYPQLAAARNGGPGRLVDAPAPAAETVLAKPCDACLHAPAHHRQVVIIVGEKARDLCVECRARLDAAGGTKGDWEKRSPRPVRRMRGAIAALGRDVHFPDDFYRQVAERPAGAKDTTQLALVHADGNRVGAFLRAAADHARRTGTPRKDEIAQAIDAATVAALGRAVVETFLPPSGTCPDPQRPPVLTHLAGGDDLMVSVPAGDGWPFARALLRAFGEELATVAVEKWKMPPRTVPTLSAGLVFHHYAHPFSDAAAIAFSQLKEAKRRTSGEQAAVAFLDLTADGAAAPGHRQVCTLAWLKQHADLLTDLAGAPAAHRHTLIEQHRRTIADLGPRQPSSAETPEQAFARRVIDRSHPAVIAAARRAVADPTLEGEDLRAQLESDPAARQALRHFLDVARWWPPSPQPEEAS